MVWIRIRIQNRVRDFSKSDPELELDPSGSGINSSRYTTPASLLFFILCVCVRKCRGYAYISLVGGGGVCSQRHNNSMVFFTYSCSAPLSSTNTSKKKKKIFPLKMFFFSLSICFFAYFCSKRKGLSSLLSFFS
jgi:hypothetical protein